MKPVTYSAYLELDKVLDAQNPKSEGPEHDEMLFIIIHQVYELWFKQILHELDHLMNLMDKSDTMRMSHTLVRVLKILKVQVAQLDILETMTPLEFLSFRERLESASGFQSYQFRELEFLLGHKRIAMVEHFPPESDGRARLETRFNQPSLWRGFLKFLASQGFSIPDASLSKDITESDEASEDVQAILVDLYRNNPGLLQICELLVDFDEGIQEWRYRHVKMVERTIGRKMGSGGSSGVEYLTSTLFQPVFPDLWAIRSEL